MWQLRQITVDSCTAPAQRWQPTSSPPAVGLSGSDTRADRVATHPGYGCWRQSMSASSVGMVSTASHPAEPHAGSVSSKLNWLRAGVFESEAGGGAKPGLPLPMGQLAQPFPAYLAQLPLGVTLPPLDPGSLNSIALKSLWVGMQLLAAHRRSCGQPSSHQTSRRDTAGRTKKIGHDGETKSDGHRVRRTHHPQVADRRVDIGFENLQIFL